MEPANNSKQVSQTFTVTPPQPAANSTPPKPQNISPKKNNFWKIITVLIILTLLSTSGVAGYAIFKNLQTNNQEVACTMEAMICPDGSSVGRSGPNCEFSPCPTASSFEVSNVMYSVSFVNSKGEAKKIIVYKIGEEESIPRANTYIVDEDLSKKNAIKIEIGDFGYQANRNLNCDCDIYLKIVPSPGSKSELIAIESFVADSALITVINDIGQIIVDGNALSQEVLSFVKDECQCSLSFDSWKDSNSINVKVSTAFGNTYVLTTDARTGKKIGEIVKST